MLGNITRLHRGIAPLIVLDRELLCIFILLLHPLVAQLCVCVRNCLCGLVLVLRVTLLGLPSTIGLLCLTEAILGPTVCKQTGALLMLSGACSLLLALLPGLGHRLLVCLGLSLSLVLAVWIHLRIDKNNITLMTWSLLLAGCRTFVASLLLLLRATRSVASGQLWMQMTCRLPLISSRLVSHLPIF